MTKKQRLLLHSRKNKKKRPVRIIEKKHYFGFVYVSFRFNSFHLVYLVSFPVVFFGFMSLSSCRFLVVFSSFMSVLQDSFYCFSTSTLCHVSSGTYQVWEINPINSLTNKIRQRIFILEFSPRFLQFYSFIVSISLWLSYNTVCGALVITVLFLQLSLVF